jgi:hypothetical protein
MSALILPIAFGVITASAANALLPTNLRPPYILTLLLALPLATGYERFVLFPLSSLLNLNARWLIATFLAVASAAWGIVASLCFLLRGLSWSSSLVIALWLFPIGASYAVAFICFVHRDARA